MPTKCREDLLPDWTIATPGQLSRHLAVSVHKILSWIHDGSLTAINVGAKTTARPVFRIQRSDFDAFAAERASKRCAPASKRRRTPSKIKSYV